MKYLSNRRFVKFSINNKGTSCITFSVEIPRPALEYFRKCVGEEYLSCTGPSPTTKTKADKKARPQDT